MRPTLFSTRTILQSSTSRLFSTSRPALTSWSTGPSPPRLPKEEQEIYEQLQKQSTGAFSTPRAETTAESADTSPSSLNSSSTNATSSASPTSSSTSTAQQDMLAQIRARGDGDELHPNVRRGAAPEFEGESNPRTGEVGGPKNDPVRWGSTDVSGDWSFNGRVSDF